MRNQRVFKGGLIDHLFYLSLLITIALSGCGDLTRDERPRRDVIIITDANAYDYTYSGEVTDDISNDIQNYSDSYEEDINSVDYIEDIYSYTNGEEAEIDITYGDTYYSDTYSEADTYFQDGTYDSSTVSDIGTDVQPFCDCDAGSDCGRCYYPGTEGLKNQALKDRLYQLISNHHSLGYDSAREKMFTEIDNKDGLVECVYTGFKIKTDTIPDPNIMNTEHTWPQSRGAGSEPARSDLFHLFPTKSEANSRRGNYPFGTVVKVIWSDGGSKLGTNSKGETVFEPRDVHKGNVARAMFYFSIRYRLPIDNEQEAELRKWHWYDPVDSDEINRCNLINKYQNNRNPFVDWPQFVNDIDDF